MHRAIPGIVHIDIDPPALAGHKAPRAGAMKTAGAALPAGLRAAFAQLEPAAEAAPRRYHHLDLRISPDLA